MGSGNGDFISASVVTLSLTILPGSDLSGTYTETGYSGLDNDKITIGGGNNDYVKSDGDFYHNTISLRNGNNDYVIASGLSSTFTPPGGPPESGYTPVLGNNNITLGNGNHDTVTIAASGGVDEISTGTGANDKINVGSHGSPDTFGFALGTNGSHFTTVTGALSGDLIVESSGQLGNTLSPLSGATTDTSLASYIKSLGTLTPGDTYVGHNAADTFVVTDTASGQTGAIEIVGVFHPTQANLAGHVLTLA
jgi:hypothetical protein